MAKCVYRKKSWGLRFISKKSTQINLTLPLFKNVSTDGIKPPTIPLLYVTDVGIITQYVIIILFFHNTNNIFISILIAENYKITHRHTDLRI